MKVFQFSNPFYTGEIIKHTTKSIPNQVTFLPFGIGIAKFYVLSPAVAISILIDEE